MPLVNLRVDEDLKRRMDDVEINWSETIRDRIEEVLEERRRVNRARAVALMERIRAETPPGFDSVETIRKMREERHGYRRS